MPECDLAALAIHLRYPEESDPTYLSQHMGRAVQDRFFWLIGKRLATAIHPTEGEGTDRQMPFTVSGLLRAGSNTPIYGVVQGGDEAWIRLTGLNATVVSRLNRRAGVLHQALLRARRQNKRLCMEINYLPWEITKVDWDNQMLPGRFSYAQLIDRQRYSRPASRITLNFAAATTFRSQSVNLPLPLPYLVFGSLVTRWQAFTALRLRDLPNEQVDAFIKYHVLLSRHEVKTALYRFKDGGKEVGFTGSAQFELARRSDHLQKHEPALEALLRREYVWFARTMLLLAEFAYYSGVGRKTTAGMGLIRA